jgi:selenocysteine-specific translation elongation factor
MCTSKTKIGNTCKNQCKAGEDTCWMHAEKPTCSICLSEVDNDKLITECNHVFHKDCVQGWLEVNTNCPVCRHELPLNKKQKKQKEERVRTSAQSQWVQLEALELIGRLLVTANQDSLRVNEVTSVCASFIQSIENNTVRSTDWFLQRTNELQS